MFASPPRLKRVASAAYLLVSLVVIAMVGWVTWTLQHDTKKQPSAVVQLAVDTSHNVSMPRVSRTTLRLRQIQHDDVHLDSQC